MNGVILLAAGLSRRFGSDKRLAIYKETTLLDCSITKILGSGLSLLTVLRHDDFELRDQLSEKYPDGHFLRCPDSALGLGHSLSFGIEQASNLRFDGAAIALANMPWIESSSYGAVAKRITADKIIVPRYREHHGQPVGYGKRYFAELASYRGDEPPDSIWRSHMDRVEYLELDDEGILKQVTFPEDISDQSH